MRNAIFAFFAPPPLDLLDESLDDESFPPQPLRTTSDRTAAAATTRNLEPTLSMEPLLRGVFEPHGARRRRASFGDQRDLDRAAAIGDQVEALFELRDWQLVRADTVHRQPAGLDHGDRCRPATGGPKGAEDVEFLVVGDDAPVDRGVVLEDRVLDEGPEFAQDLKPLRDGRRVARRLQVDVRAIAIRERSGRRHGVVLGDVDRNVCATRLGQLQLVVLHVEGDHLGGVLRGRASDHAEPNRPAARHDHDVLEADRRALHGVQRAAQWLDERRVVCTDLLGDLVHQRVAVIDHVTRHAAWVRALEAVDRVRRAHVVLAAQAVTAPPAGDNLLGDDAIAHADAPALGGLLVEGDDAADELVARDHAMLGPRRSTRVAPELRGTEEALQIRGAYATRLHLDERFARTRFRHRELFQAVVPRPVADHGLHRRGYGRVARPG